MSNIFISVIFIFMFIWAISLLTSCFSCTVLFVILGAQLKQAAGVPEYISGAVAITTKVVATGLIALYWLPEFTSGLVP